ncbi:MAG: MBL fold metallo-hydrolase [Thermoplasmata archaeon]|nr:MAG: MBL fold metallo-hydrolase [Thermoplasmata archaeon]
MTQAPTTYSFNIGNFECVVINDFSRKVPLSALVINAEEENVERVIRENKYMRDTIDYNNLLVKTENNIVLVDTGLGNRTEIKGKLLLGLSSIGIEPKDIDSVVITHGDGDHIGGILNDQNDVVFPNARYFMWKEGWDSWTKAENHPERSMEIISFFRDTFSMISDRLELVGSGEEFLPGFTMIPAVGHKRDHTALSISSNKEKLLHIADTVIHPFFMAYYHWNSVLDSLLDQALKSKTKLLDRASSKNELVFGAHFPFPGLGHVVKNGDVGWLWQPFKE